MSAAGLGTLTLPISAWPAPQEEPHFFLQVYVYGGLDSLFLFDARPKAMTKAGLIHDYMKEEPLEWMGQNGVSTLATSLARTLSPHRERFSVVNGVFMSTAFDGHLQNVNFLYTGNPFGGESFIPHLNDRTDPVYAKRPLDAIQSGAFQVDLTNSGNTIPISPDSAINLVTALKKSRQIDPAHPVTSFLDSRFQSLGRGSGKFSLGNRAMSAGYLSAPDLSDRLKRLQLSGVDAGLDSEARFVEMMSGCFKEGICSSAILELVPKEGILDVHAGRLAQEQKDLYPALTARVKRVFDLLVSTPFSDKQSLFDVTTVVFASEFGRTLRQAGVPLNETGTDHNSLNNSILIGGKGIRGRLVIGETDWRAAGETLSGAHKHLDANSMKLMGKPFDFTTSRPRQDKPQAYEADDYLTMASVVNTIYSAFSVPRTHWRTVKRDGPKAPVITGLLN